jgi:hypothetical protein
MIIIESNNNFFTKCDIIHYNLTYYIDPNDSGLRYRMNFIIVGKTNYDNDFRTLISLHKLDRVYIKNGNDIEILSNLSICESMTNSNICVCDHCISDVRLKSSNKLKKVLKDIIKDDDTIKVSNNIHYKNYAIFYNIVDNQVENKKSLIKL